MATWKQWDGKGQVNLERSNAAKVIKPAPPQSVKLNDVRIEMWTVGQLQELSRPNLKTRVMNLKDALGDSLDLLPPLQTSGDTETVIGWMVRAQCAAARASGYPDLTPEDLGLPPDATPAVHVLRDKERERLHFAGVGAPTANLVPSETVDGQLGFSPTKLAVKKPSGPAWASYSSTYNDSYEYGAEHSQAAKDSNSVGAATKIRNQGSKMSESMARTDPEGAAYKSTTKTDFADHSATMQVRSPIRPKAAASNSIIG